MGPTKHWTRQDDSDWNLELYEGIDGRQTNIAEHDLKFYTANKKVED